MAEHIAVLYFGKAYQRGERGLYSKQAVGIGLTHGGNGVPKLMYLLVESLLGPMARASGGELIVVVDAIGFVVEEVLHIVEGYEVRKGTALCHQRIETQGSDYSD